MKRTTAELRETKPGRHEFLSLPRAPLSLVVAGLKMENLGSVFRVADAARLQSLYLCGVPYTPDSLRFRKAAKGAHRWVPHECRDSAVEVVQGLKESGMKIIALEQCHDSVRYDRVRYPFPAVLVIGREREGLADELLALADLKVEIPMRGMSNSLNVAVSVGVVVFHMLGQLELQQAERDPAGLDAAGPDSLEHGPVAGHRTER